MTPSIPFPPPTRPGEIRRGLIFVSAAVLIFILGLWVRLGLNSHQQEWVGTACFLGLPILMSSLIGIGRPHDSVATCGHTNLVCLGVLAPFLGEGFFCILFLAPITLLLSMPFAALTGYVMRRHHLSKAITHTTRYERFLGPGFLIQPLEEYFGHHLQAYLLLSWAAESQNGSGETLTRPMAAK